MRTNGLGGVERCREGPSYHLGRSCESESSLQQLGAVEVAAASVTSPFSRPAKRLYEDISETIDFFGCEASCELADRDEAYESYIGSPASQGQLQLDHGSVKPRTAGGTGRPEREMAKRDLRNSTLFVPMLTAVTAQILVNR